MLIQRSTLGVSVRIAAFLLIGFSSFDAQGQVKRKVILPGQRAVVFDERLSALRKEPDLKAPLQQRLRRGRIVGILDSTKDKSKSGTRFLRVAVTRNTRGWILDSAVLRPGNKSDGERLMKLIEETQDDFTKAKLARLYADDFRGTRSAPHALLILGEAAERAAERLTRDAKRRVGDGESVAESRKRHFFLSYVGLDRYNRIGVTFDYDEASERIVYDRAAYRELLRRYPRSEEAIVARQRFPN